MSRDDQDREVAGSSAVPHYHVTDCSEFMLRIYEYMDGEMGAEEHLRFEAHVRQCRPCLQQHDLDQKVRGLIRRVSPSPVAPASLRAAIVARIMTTQVDPSQPQ